ncbi:MAG: hypothetical protein NTV86_16200, partial [Planctomycetota bacterium]|nr:hypothetical protein [Planctomycetota bacterium]
MLIRPNPTFCPKPFAPTTAKGTLYHLLVLMAILGGLTLLMFGDVLFGGSGTVLSHRGADMASQYAYWRQFGFAQLQNGVMPLWNPHVFCGVPFVGGFQSAMLYPPNLMYLALPLDRAINVSFALHVFLMGLFVYLWAWHRKMSPPAGLLAGALAMFGGPYFLHVYAGHVCLMSTAVWAPLLFLAADALLTEPKLKWVLTGSLAAAMSMLAGNPQCTYYTFLAMLLYVGANALGSLGRLRVRGSVKLAVLLACVLLAGASLAAAQLLTAMGAAGESPRGAGLTVQYAGSFSFPPENFLTFLAPGFFGLNDSHPYHYSANEAQEIRGSRPMVLVSQLVLETNMNTKQLASLQEGLAEFLRT